MANAENERELTLTPVEKAKLEVLRALAAEGFRELDEGKGIVLHNDQELVEFMDEIDRRVAQRHSKVTSPDPPPRGSGGPS